MHLLKTKKEFENLCKQEIQTIIKRLTLIKPVSDMIWLIANVKNLTERTQSDKGLREKAFQIASNSKNDVY